MILISILELQIYKFCKVNIMQLIIILTIGNIILLLSIIIRLLLRRWNINKTKYLLFIEEYQD